MMPSLSVKLSAIFILLKLSNVCVFILQSWRVENNGTLMYVKK